MKNTPTNTPTLKERGQALYIYHGHYILLLVLIQSVKVQSPMTHSKRLKLGHGVI